MNESKFEKLEHSLIDNSIISDFGYSYCENISVLVPDAMFNDTVKNTFLKIAKECDLTVEFSRSDDNDVYVDFN